MNAESATQNMRSPNGVQPRELVRGREAAKLQLQLDIALERARLGLSHRREARARLFIRCSGARRRASASCRA